MIVILCYQLAKRQHAWLLELEFVGAPEAGSVYFGRPATVHARAQSKCVIAVALPPAAAACDRKGGGAGAFRTPAPGCDAWVRDRQYLR